jgi:hypothetical protein
LPQTQPPLRRGGVTSRACSVSAWRETSRVGLIGWHVSSSSNLALSPCPRVGWRSVSGPVRRRCDVDADQHTLSVKAMFIFWSLNWADPYQQPVSGPPACRASVCAPREPCTYQERPFTSFQMPLHAGRLLVSHRRDSASRSLITCPSARRMQGSCQGDRKCGSGFTATRPQAKPSSMRTSRHRISAAGNMTLAPLSWKRTWSGNTTQRKMSGMRPIPSSCGP